MKRVDIGAAFGGASFLAMAMYFLVNEDRASFSDLGITFPVLLVVLGVGLMLNDRSRP